MKKLLVLSLVLGIASLASARLLLSVDGIIDPPDTEIWLMPSQWVTIDVWSDGQTQSDGFLLMIEGPAHYDTSQAVNYVNTGAIEDFGQGMVLIDLAKVAVPIPPIPTGTVVDFIRLHCEGPGDVLLTLSNLVTGELMDTQIIHQIPEPATMALLGLGGLLLRKRK